MFFKHSLVNYSVLLRFIWVHRITELVRLEGTTAGHLAQPSSSPRPSQSTLHGIVSRWFPNISSKGESTAFLGNLFQYSVILTGKKFFLIFWWNLLCVIICLLPLVLARHYWEEPASILLTLFVQILMDIGEAHLTCLFLRLNRDRSLSLSS